MPVPGLTVRIAVLGALMEAVLTLAALGGRAVPDPVDPVTVFLEPKRSWLARDEGRSMLALPAGRRGNLKQRLWGLSHIRCTGLLVMYLSVPTGIAGVMMKGWRYAETDFMHNSFDCVIIMVTKL